MDYTPVTPFRRAINAALLKCQPTTPPDLPPNGVNKWEVLRELATARQVFGLSDRDLTVLQALVSFHQNTTLGDTESNLIVHPSNKTICERLNGMPCSTMRRHLGHLVDAGVLIRRDSPNGKRYARRYGKDKIAFGFDLTPLVRRFSEFCDAAETVRAQAEKFRRLRETVSLMRRDLAALSSYGEECRPDLPVWTRFADLAALTARDLRRKLQFKDLEKLSVILHQALDLARDVLEPQAAANLSTSDTQIEQHHQNSNKDSHDFEPAKETNTNLTPIARTKPQEHSAPKDDEETVTNANTKLPNLPLGMILQACKEIQLYSEGTIRHWHEFVKVVDTVRPMMGISPTAWDDAKRFMGVAEASVVLAAMLDRIVDIRSPGGYLRSLSGKASVGEFSSGPMIMALMRRDAA